MTTMPTEDRPSLGQQPETHVENAIASLSDALRRVVRGIECLDLDLITSAGEKLRAADASLVRAIELRRDRNRIEEGEGQ